MLILVHRKLFEKLNIYMSKYHYTDFNILVILCYFVAYFIIYNFGIFYYSSQLESIEAIQDHLNTHDAVLKTLSLVERQNDGIVKEYLSFLASMLFNANVKSQVSFIKHLERYQVLPEISK